MIPFFLVSQLADSKTNRARIMHQKRPNIARQIYPNNHLSFNFSATQLSIALLEAQHLVTFAFADEIVERFHD